MDHPEEACAVLGVTALPDEPDVAPLAHEPSEGAVNLTRTFLGKTGGDWRRSMSMIESGLACFERRPSSWCVAE